MTRVSVLAHLEAMEGMRAVPLTAYRHRHLSDRPLVIIPLTVAGEAGAPLAAMAGTERNTPHLIVVPQPRNRDHRIAFAAELGQLVVSYIDSCRSHRRPVAARRGEQPSTRYSDAPQVIVPNTGGIKALADLGRMCRFRSITGPYAVAPMVPRLGTWLTFLAEQAEQAGTAMLLAATDLLGEHWATGQSSLENQNLASVLAWIDPPEGRTVAQALRDAENPRRCPPAGPTTDPGFDNTELNSAKIAFERARAAGDSVAMAAAEAEAAAALAGQLEPTWQSMWKAIALLRAVAQAPRAADRFERDCQSFTDHADYLDGGGFPQPKRDSPSKAARRLSRLERALETFGADRAFDDPYVLADLRSIGEAFAGLVVDVDHDRGVTTEKGKRVPRPRITVRTEDPVRLGTHVKLISPSMPAGHKAEIVDTRPDGEAVLVQVEVTGGMGRRRTPAEGTVPRLGQRISYLPDPGWRPSPQFPAPDQTPWTHGGTSGEPTEPDNDDAAEQWGDD